MFRICRIFKELFEFLRDAVFNLFKFISKRFIFLKNSEHLQNENLFNCSMKFFYLISNQIHSVDEFVCSVNSHLTTRQENERLNGLMARIESYDVVVRK